MIIGLTGTKASGKGVVAEILKEKGFVYYSLSDAVRDEAMARGLINYNVSQLQDIGNELRKTHGNGILARRILEKIRGKRNNEGKKTENYVIDGIRNTGEIDELAENRYGKFFLVAVDAPLETRFKRILERGRNSDPKKWQEFLEMDKRDRGIGSKTEESFGQQVDECIRMSDIKVYNDSSVDALKHKIKKILQELKC